MRRTEEEKQALVDKVRAKMASGMKQGEACKALGVPTVTFYKYNKVIGAKKRKVRKVLTITEAPTTPEKLICVIGTPQTIHEFIRGLT